MFTDLKPKVILFDFYETLLNIWTDENDEAVWNQLARFLQYRGVDVDSDNLRQSYDSAIKQRSDQSKEKHTQIDLCDVFHTLMKEFGYSGADELHVTALQLFRVLSIRHFRLFPDTIPILQALAHNYKLGLISDAQRVFFDAEIQITGLKPFFAVTIVSSDYPFHKPDPRMFTMALDKLGILPGEALFIGDSLSRDVMGAQSAGIRSILLNRKRKPYDFEDATRPDEIITSLNDLRHVGLDFSQR